MYIYIYVYIHTHKDHMADLQGVDQFPRRRAGHLGSGGLWLQPSGDFPSDSWAITVIMWGFKGQFKNISSTHIYIYRDVELWVLQYETKLHSTCIVYIYIDDNRIDGDEMGQTSNTIL